MAVQQALSLAQFMVWLGTQGMKYEYDRGRIVPHIVAMSGGTTPHNLIERNLVRELDSAFEDSPFEAFTSNQLVATADGEVGYFPDAVLMDGLPRTVRYGTQYAATNPAAIFEIASSSTREYDGGRKLEVYQSIPSMREVFLIESDEAHVVRHFRTDTGWDQETITGRDATFWVLGLPIPMARLYRKVELVSDASLPSLDG